MVGREARDGACASSPQVEFVLYRFLQRNSLQDDSGSSAASVLSGFSMTFGWRRGSLGALANGSGSAISSGPLSSMINLKPGGSDF